jgi:uncharacterized protein YjbJ (UPF0337 family)
MKVWDLRRVSLPAQATAPNPGGGARYSPAELSHTALKRSSSLHVMRSRSPKVTDPHNRRSIAVDWNRVEGNWKQIKGKVKEQWGKLTDDDLDVVAGKRDQLEGKIQERYGYAKDKTKKEVDDWYNTQRW